MVSITSQAAAAMNAAQAAETACEVRAFEERSPEIGFTTLDLSLRDREAFFEAVLAPPSPNQQLRAAAQRYLELFRR